MKQNLFGSSKQYVSKKKNGAFKLPWFTRSIYLMHAFCPALWRPVRCKHILPLCTSWSLWWLMTAENARLKIRRRREPFYSSIILSIRRNHKFSSAEKKKQTVAQGRSTRQISFKWSECVIHNLKNWSGFLSLWHRLQELLQAICSTHNAYVGSTRHSWSRSSDAPSMNSPLTTRPCSNSSLLSSNDR